ncbi:hypothetical protein CALVIDRAFT_301036 [Calocera viscosa TUFC12733]|uniref:Uncharacterized protein n=1 Tax=Calocera viscosa (strain TUFC12733) TaxID=1330018 RepID=A0A167IIE7_CALVF|nr:hypothetical protein CALVIDRAFT_301036 [Calocera viscosa TUFC12733]
MRDLLVSVQGYSFGPLYYASLYLLHPLCRLTSVITLFHLDFASRRRPSVSAVRFLLNHHLLRHHNRIRFLVHGLISRCASQILRCTPVDLDGPHPLSNKRPFSKAIDQSFLA